MSSEDFFVRRYGAELAKTFDPDTVTLTFGAPHEARLTLAAAMDAKDAWRDDTYLSIVWVSDARKLGQEPIEARFVFGVTEASATASPTQPSEVSLERVRDVERRRKQIGNEPVTRDDPFYVQKGLTCTGEPSWGVVGPAGAVVEVLLGEKVLAKKKPTAGARVLRAGKVTAAGVAVTRVEIGESGWAPFELPLAALSRQGKELGMKAPSLWVFHTPAGVEVAGKRPTARRLPPEPIYDEAKLLVELVSSMKDSAIDCFPPGVRIVGAERAHEHIVLRYEHRKRPALARAHRPEPVTTRSALRDVEDDLSREIGRDTGDE